MIATAGGEGNALPWVNCNIIVSRRCKLVNCGHTDIDNVDMPLEAARGERAQDSLQWRERERGRENEHTVLQKSSRLVSRQKEAPRLESISCSSLLDGDVVL